MPSARKPRSDAKLLNLPDDRREQLAAWLLGGMGYETARVAVRRDWGISTSVGSLREFYLQECQPRLLSRRTRAAQAASELVRETVGAAEQIDAALVAQVKQNAFELLINPAADPKSIKAVVSQALALKAIESRDRDRDLKREALQVDRERLEVETCKKFLAWFRDAAAREIAESKASNAEKIAKLRQMMFADVEAAAAAAAATAAPAPGGAA